MLSTMGLHILSILQGVPRSPRNLRRHIDERIQPAQLLITRRYHETIIIEQLARELHIGYSSFRQAFKAQTGQALNNISSKFVSRRRKSFLRIPLSRLEKSLRYSDLTRPTICLINSKNMWV
jgi:AraC-like DNA-binding protein